MPGRTAVILAAFAAGMIGGFGLLYAQNLQSGGRVEARMARVDGLTERFDALTSKLDAMPPTTGARSTRSTDRPVRAAPAAAASPAGPPPRMTMSKARVVRRSSPAMGPAHPCV